MRVKIPHKDSRLLSFTVDGVASGLICFEVKRRFNDRTPVILWSNVENPDKVYYEPSREEWVIFISAHDALVFIPSIYVATISIVPDINHHKTLSFGEHQYSFELEIVPT